MSSAAISGDDSSKPHLIFSYGTLKHGFHNHKLTAELISQNHAAFIGTYITRRAYPLVCGPHGLPYLINLPGSGRRVRGELYAVSPQGLARLDDLERTSIGHYERLALQLVVNAADEDGVEAAATEAEAYFAHRSFGEAMWERSGREGLSEFTEVEARSYVKRQDRPHQGRDIIEDVRRFVYGDCGGSLGNSPRLYK